MSRRKLTAEAIELLEEIREILHEGGRDRWSDRDYAIVCQWKTLTEEWGESTVISEAEVDELRAIKGRYSA